jgi:hypothetical protein
MVQWITSNWEVISIAVLVLINVLNAATKHWSGHAGVVKWLLFATEILSILKSQSLKLPFSRGPLIALAILTSLAFSACATTETGEKKFSPDMAMQIACKAQPAVSGIHALVCSSISDEKKRKDCMAAKEKADLYGGAVLSLAQGIYGACTIR